MRLAGRRAVFQSGGFVVFVFAGGVMFFEGGAADEVQDHPYRLLSSIGSAYRALEAFARAFDEDQMYSAEGHGSDSVYREVRDQVDVLLQDGASPGGAGSLRGLVGRLVSLFDVSLFFAQDDAPAGVFDDVERAAYRAE